MKKKEKPAFHYASLFKATGVIYIISALMVAIVAVVLLLGIAFSSDALANGTLTRADIRVTAGLGVALLVHAIASLAAGTASMRCRSLKSVASGAKFVLVMCLVCLVLTLLQGGTQSVTTALALSLILGLLSLLSVRTEKRRQAQEAEKAAAEAAKAAIEAAQE